jgi:hypothetical protein
MRGTDQSEAVVGVLAIALLAMVAIWRIILWIKNSPCRPNPWEADTEHAVQQPDAVPVCHHCLTPVPSCQWFCETCGCAVGPYNNWMPYVYIFSQGEVLRNGVTNRVRTNATTIGGYLFVSLSGYLVLAPLYWYFLLRNLRRTKPQDDARLSEG